MNLVMIGQEKRDLLIQVTAWSGLTIYIYCLFPCFYRDTRAYIQCMNGCG